MYAISSYVDFDIFITILNTTTTAALCISASLTFLSQRSRHGSKGSFKVPYEPSPPKSLPNHSQHQDFPNENEGLKLPYPPDALTGARDVETPYGSVRVYEWGPEDAEAVLLVHGISTPVVALGDLAHELVGRGYRVMMFDLFGRGYSDAPTDLPYDARLYTTQILLVLSSSKLLWTTFHLVGYSLGGSLAVSFTRYFPHRVRSLSLIAPSGLIRRHHVGWRSWLYYDSGLLPESLVAWLVRRRIRPDVKTPGGPDIITAESEHVVKNNNTGDSDANGGVNFDSAAISKSRPNVTVASVVAWQVDHHKGFVRAFLSTIRHAPIYLDSPQQDDSWKVLSKILEEARRSSDAEAGTGLERGKIFLVLGRDDCVIVLDEIIADARTVLGNDGFKFAVIEGGHEVPITASTDVAESIAGFWKSISL
ncbi:alpha/beta-hydrolase [Xylaria venustula]|nr:alpha/beta-hydrolase [Xylaria venustula]